MVSSYARTIAAAALLCTFPACGNDDESRSPSSPTPVGRAAAITIENFTATATPGGNVITYAISLTLRESAGVGATISGVTLTLTQTSGATAARDFSAVEAFGTTRIAASGTLPSSVTFTGPPVMASQLAARVTFTDDNGNSGSAQSTTIVRNAATASF